MRPRRHLATSVAALVVALGTSPSAADLGRPDLAAVIYSNQFTFDTTGAPVVRVGLADGLVSARFTATGPVRFEPEGRGGPVLEFSKGGTWTVTVEGGRPARVRTWLAVERVDPPVPARVQAALAVWRSRGFADARAFDFGAVFGFAGRVMDSRYTLVTVAGTDDPVAVARTAAAIEETYGIRPTPQDVQDRVPGGRIRITSAAKKGPIMSNPRVFRVSPGHARTRFELVSVDRGGRPAGAGKTNPSGRKYRGSLYFAVGREGSLAVGNDIAAETLLAGLVPAEIFATASEQALRVQAVTARNEVLAKVGTRHLTDPYLLCDDVHCQVYPGAGRETRRTTAAVDATRGEMLFRDGRLVDAVYSASCGGSGEANDAVWPIPADPALQQKFDAPVGRHASAPLASDSALERFLNHPPQGAYCKVSSFAGHHFRWDRRLGVGRLTDLVNRKHSVGRVTDLAVTERGPGGRAIEMVIRGELGTATVRGELVIRRLLGGLKSALFVVALERKKSGKLKAVSFSGGGFGHGVGMCQIGAIGRAEAGGDYRDILRHYYSGAEVKKIY